MASSGWDAKRLWNGSQSKELDTDSRLAGKDKLRAPAGCCLSPFRREGDNICEVLTLQGRIDSH